MGPVGANGRMLVVVTALVGASYAVVAWLGVIGLGVTVALWLGALPWLCRPWTGFGVELGGAAFVLLTAAYVDSLDEVLGVGRVSLIVLLVGAGYLWLRRGELGATMQSPVSLCLAAFLAQQCLSAFLVAPQGGVAVAINRASIFLAFIAAATLARRPGGAQLMAWAMLLGALVSVPVLAREVMAPEQLRFWSVDVQDAARAGGLYQQPNNAGAALDFALAATLALRLEGAVSASLATGLAAALALGILCTASRGAFLIALAIGAAAALTLAWARAGLRTTLALAAAATLAILLLRQPAAVTAVAALRAIDDTEVTNLGRLEEVVLALGGAPEDMMEHDAQRGDLAQLALARIADRPLWGYGTGNFMSDDQRSHIEILEILGENGVVGAFFYGLLLLEVGRALLRPTGRARVSRCIVGGSWLMMHLDHHNMVELRFMILPLAFACSRGEQGGARGERLGDGGITLFS
jgi:O-antigen ligase